MADTPEATRTWLAAGGGRGASRAPAWEGSGRTLWRAFVTAGEGRAGVVEQGHQGMPPRRRLDVEQQAFAIEQDRLTRQNGSLRGVQRHEAVLPPHRRADL